MAAPARTVIVEDLEDLIVMYRVALKGAGADVTTLGPVEAADFGDWPDIDVLITDWMMPTFSGADIIRIARAANPDIECHVITAAVTIEEAGLPGLPDGVTLHAKPVDFDRLRELVRAHG